MRHTRGATAAVVALTSRAPAPMTNAILKIQLTRLTPRRAY
jgi:hypothetical protein